MFDHTNILHIFIIFIHCKFFHSLSHTLNNICTNGYHTLTCIFTFFLHKGSMKQSTTKLTHVPLLWFFILDEFLYIHKTLLFISTTKNQNFYLFNSSTSVSLCLHFSSQVVTQHYQEVKYLAYFSLYITCIWVTLSNHSSFFS